MKLSIGLISLVGILISSVMGQQRPGSADFIVSSCKRSLLQLDLPAVYLVNKNVTFAAIDQYGSAYEIGDQLAVQCGYRTSSDFWGNVTFRASLMSCYTQILDDQSTITIRINIFPTWDKSASVSYLKQVTCPYAWDAREILCEMNYMEVSVRRKIPMIAESALQDEPEDWVSAFPEAVAGLVSIWQVVFHLPSTRKAMLVRDAQKIGYGINTTESRMLLRSPYKTAETQLLNIGGVNFSSVRSTILYKQRWMILMVDTAVACPVDDVKYTKQMITWSVPKVLLPLLIGASRLKNSRIAFGVDLLTLTSTEIANRKYGLMDNYLDTTVNVPVGAQGGYFKSHVSNGQYGITYSINVFLEHEWDDSMWGVTKHTIIKEITTPFDAQLTPIINETISTTKTFNVTIGPFLPDVQLVNITVGLETLTIPELMAKNYNLTTITYPNGSVAFRLTVPFTDQNVKIEYIGETTRVYILVVTFGFKIIPTNETFTCTTTIVTLVRDAVLPQPSGYCDLNTLNVIVKRGNVDINWIPYVNNIPLTPETAQSNGVVFMANSTHYTITVNRYSDNVMYEESNNAGMTVTLPLTLVDNTNGNPMSTFSVSCSYPTEKLIDCFPNGTIAVTVLKLSTVPDMELSQLVLRDKSCRPVIYTDTSAKFVFPVNTCLTTRKFTQTMMIYENDVYYYRPGLTDAAYKLHVACNYTTNQTLILQYGYEVPPSPSAQAAFGTLALVLRLSKDSRYSTFYGDAEYPVVKYLMDALYFEVELLYSVDPQLELFLDNCWATASPDKTSFPKWDVVVNSCEFVETYQTIFHPVAADSRVVYPSHLKRFEVKMFTFMNADRAYLGEIYFHCSVIICDAVQLYTDPLCTKSCIPARQRTGRSAKLDTDRHQYVSSGALLLKSNVLSSLSPY
uniref:Egg envelope component ZPAX n=1 Tax=Xenopus laevis TaxID=8355 RepID=B7ZQD3_XENLA|nr:Egg envelope component ZPAX [Xenopus laevis]AAI69768.1 Egg envelope component ZPAX [Xenopus laevis]